MQKRHILNKFNLQKLKPEETKTKLEQEINTNLEMKPENNSNGTTMKIR